MPRLSRKEFDAVFAALARLARGDEGGREQLLARALASGSGHLVARAAALVRDDERERFLPSLIEAAAALFGARDPVKDDPGCAGKAAALDALDRLDYELEGPFRRAQRYVQKEGQYPPTDTATGVRARAGLALVRLRVPDALCVLADMLCDDEPAVRAAGAEGVHYHGDERGAALLRMKLHAGDPEPDVLTAVLAAYLRLDPTEGLTLTRARLTGPSRTDRESAALALGETRVPPAHDLLVLYLEATHSEADTRAAVASLLLLRDTSARESLRSFARTHPAPHGPLAAEALARYERALRGES